MPVTTASNSSTSMMTRYSCYLYYCSLWDCVPDITSMAFCFIPCHLPRALVDDSENEWKIGFQWEKKWDKFHTLIYGHLVIYHRWNGKTLLKHGSKTRGRFWYLENWQDYRNVFTFHHNPLEAKLQMIEQKMSTLSQSIISLGIFPPWLHAWWVIFPVLQVVIAISTLRVITLDR